MVVFSLIFISFLSLLNKVNYSLKNKELIEVLLNETNSIKSNHLRTFKYTFNFNFLRPRQLLSNNYINLVTYKPKEKENNVMEPVISLQHNNKPTVYIYNTHQREQYKANDLELYDLKPTVLTASYILKENFYKAGIYSVVEEADVQGILNANKWAYARSYAVTRTLMEEAFSKYPTLEYFIDLHRDSVSKKISTVEIEGKSYARIMFLVGLENSNYYDNLKMMEKLNSMVEEKYPGLSRGIYKKKGANVNGVYNQDFSSKCMLIEVGGEENTIEEVNNTIDAISDILISYMGGTING